MTVRLYNEDCYIQFFTAHVLHCEPLEDTKQGYKVVLDRTAFFPEGGGQSADTGILKIQKDDSEIHVLDVQEEGDCVIHYVDNFLEKGTEVEGSLNWEERFDKMQQHTAEHIASGIVFRKYGYKNVGFHLNSEIATMDFDGVLTKEELEELEMLINQGVYSNTKVQILYPEKEALEELEYRSKIEIEGQVRIVDIPDLDRCACCAPHVSYTGEIGNVKLLSVEKLRGGVRIFYACGGRALLDHQIKSKNAKEISMLLSAKEDETFEAVQKLNNDFYNMKAELVKIQQELIQLKVASVQDSEEEVLYFDENMDNIGMREFVNQLIDRNKKLVGIFVGNDEDGYRYILGSNDVDLRSISKAFHEACNGKGGGQPKMIQGNLQATRELILESIQVIWKEVRDEQSK